MVRVVIGLVFLVVMLLFVAFNSDPLQLNILGNRIYKPLPTGLVLIIFMAFAFLVGALLVWISELKQRRRARRAEALVRTLEAQLAELAQRPVATVPVGMTTAHAADPAGMTPPHAQGSGYVASSPVPPLSPRL